LRYCHYTISIIIIILFISNPLSPIYSQDKNTIINWSSPDKIDPLQEDIGEFLDQDLSKIDWIARTAQQQNNYRQAAQYYLFLLRHKVDDPITIYNLACCYGQIGKAELAAKYLIRAVNAGYTNLDQIKKDNDFNKVRGNENFKNNVKKIENWIGNLGSTIYIKASKLIKCRIQLPKNYNPQKSYTLLIGLHGNGGRADDFIQLWNGFKNQDFIFAAPQGPYRKHKRPDTKNEQYSWDIDVQDKELWKRGDPLSEEYILENANHISKQYNIKNTYLLGFSQGAAYAYLTGIKHPDLFKGIICFAGKIPETDKSYSILSKDDIKQGNKLKVFIAHGTRDSAIKHQVSLNSKSILEKYGYDVEFSSFSGGHTIPPEILQQAEQWMKKR